MDWKGLIVDALIVAVLGAGGAIVAALITNVYSNWFQPKRLSQRMGDPRNETLIDQQKNIDAHINKMDYELKELQSRVAQLEDENAWLRSQLMQSHTYTNPEG